MLDAYQEAVLGCDEGSASWERAMAQLEANNKNINRSTVGGGNWLAGIDGAQRRFVPFNGGLGKPQLGGHQRGRERDVLLPV